MKDFIKQLIEDTRDGKLDYIWCYTEGSKTYSYKQKGSSLNNLTFDATGRSDMVIFPNGFGIAFDQKELNILLDEIDRALERNVVEIMNEYFQNDLEEETLDDNENINNNSNQSEDKIIETDDVNNE